jgi:putative transposase
MLTACTYRRVPVFNSRAKLDLIAGQLFNASEKYGAELQAWAIFPNHYHFIARFGGPPRLTALVREFHALTARTVNRWDSAANRRVWFQYWDTHITYSRSYYARLNYVHRNPVRHGVAKIAENYPWCSAGWFARLAEPSFRKTIDSYPIDRLNVRDDFDVEPILD